MIASWGFSGWFGPCGKPVEKRIPKGNKNWTASSAVRLEQVNQRGSLSVLVEKAYDTTVQQVAIFLTLRLTSIQSQLSFAVAEKLLFFPLHAIKNISCCES